MKRNSVSVLLVLGLFAVGSAAFAQVASDTQAASTSVTVSNTLAVTAGDPLVLTLGSADTTTTLAYSSNDGTLYKVTASAAAWTFAPTTGSNAANGFPTLAIATVSDTNGNSTATGGLIGATNALTSVDILTGIQNEAGTITVGLLASGSTVSLTAGNYSTTLTYTLQ